MTKAKIKSKEKPEIKGIVSIEDLRDTTTSNDNLEYPLHLHNKIESLMEFFDQYGIDYDKFDKSKTPKLDLFSKAYPNEGTYVSIPGESDTKKWLQALREIYTQEKNGIPRVNAIRKSTSGWNVVETFDFLNWIKYHEAGEHMKYKVAQLWYENVETPGYFLKIKKDEPKEDTRAKTEDVDLAKDNVEVEHNKKIRIEQQRAKLIGRLNSFEKLLQSPDGHLFSGKEFETLLETVYNLKKKIQLINKVSTSTRLYDDMIVREANILHKNGFVKAASALYAFAQTPAQSGEQATGTAGAPLDALTPASPGDPSGAGNPGAPGGLPSMGPGMPQNAPSSATPESIENNPLIPKGIEGFIAALDGGNFSPGDDHKSDDELEVNDISFADDLIVEAQDANAITPPESQLTKTPQVDAVKPPAKIEEPLEVSEDDIVASKPNKGVAHDVSNFDGRMNAALENVTISDVVAKLEDLAKIFKNREIPRQLALVDLLLDSLGLASFFPSLSEATNKALDSNNYISTRVEDILSRLRGSMATKDIDLKGESPVSPEVHGIKDNLKKEEDAEKARKQMRKDQANQALEVNEKETPEIEVEEDLAPSEIKPSAPTAPAAPAAIPAPVKPV
jgi:hypothetical protein